MFRSVEFLLKPQSIAIVGASENGGGGWSRKIYQNLTHGRFSGQTFLVNPRRTELWGQKAYPDFAAIKMPVDLALVILPAEHVPGSLEEAASHGLKCAFIYASRFGEGGDAEGSARKAALQALTADGRIRIAGPNGMGALSVHDRLWMYPSESVRSLPAGDVGVIFQSGGTFQFWMRQAAVRGLGISYAISSGNEVDLDAADYINFMIEDDRTKLICCMLEGIRRPEAFMAAAGKALAAGKPVLMVKIGSSAAGQAAAQSHTGSLADDDRIFNAMCEKFGIVRCHSLDDMIETALAFSAGRYPEGGRSAMVIASGGAKGLYLDYAHESGLEFAKLDTRTVQGIAPRIDEGVPAENPLDVGNGLVLRPDAFADVCATICEDPNVDILAMHALVPVEETEVPDASAFSRLRSRTDKPIIGFGRLHQNMTSAGRAFQNTAGIPFLQGMPETVRAVKGLIAYGEVRRRPPPVIPAPAPRVAAPQGRPEDLLANYGIAPPRSAFVTSIDALPAEADRLGFPVVLKIQSPQAVHKTEVGGVAINLANGPAVQRAAEEMVERLRAEYRDATVSGFLLQEMVVGPELIVGVRDDPQFGPVMLVGLGGIFVEVLQDVCIQLLPVDETMARRMLSTLSGKAVLEGYRGHTGYDFQAVAKAMASLSNAFLDNRGWLLDLEINPLVVLERGAGVRAVDVRAVERSE